MTINTFIAIKQFRDNVQPFNNNTISKVTSQTKRVEDFLGGIESKQKNCN